MDGLEGWTWPETLIPVEQSFISNWTVLDDSERSSDLSGPSKRPQVKIAKTAHFGSHSPYQSFAISAHFGLDRKSDKKCPSVGYSCEIWRIFTVQVERKLPSGNFILWKVILQLTRIHFYSGEMASFKYMTDPVAKTQKLGQDLISSIYSRSAIDSIDFVSRHKHALLLEICILSKQWPSMSQNQKMKTVWLAIDITMMTQTLILKLIFTIYPQLDPKGLFCSHIWSSLGILDHSSSRSPGLGW